jgi:UDP-2,4-diacetamido-2,4,6-trideoxy-beta-L-altropyranose hydrolase
VNLGPGYAGPRELPGQVLDSPDRFVAAMAGTKLLVSSYGHSLLEAAHLGVPALIAVAQPDHREHAAVFAECGTAELIDMASGPRSRELAELVTALLADEPRLAAMTERGRELVDGRGAERVADAVRSLVA